MQGNLSWLLVANKPQREFVAGYRLNRQGLEVCLPQITLRRRQQGARQQVTEPLFPGYVFAGAVPGEHDIAPIRSKRGCNYVVKFGGKVRSLPDALARSFRPFHDAPFNGSPDLKVGHNVLIQAGVFEGLDAVFEKPKSTDCAQLLIIMLVQPRSAEIRMDSIDAC